MRFRLGSVPEDPEFLPDASWRPLREPTLWVLQLLAFPLGIVAFLAVGGLWLLLTPLRFVSFDSVWQLLVAFFVIVPIHELIHAAVHPLSGLSRNSILGFWPSRLVFYAHYHGELSRGRFIVILLMPFLIISILPLAICALVGNSFAFLAFASTLNAFLGCGDMFGVILLLFQVPSAATVRNQGWRTFWTIRDTKAA